MSGRLFRDTKLNFNRDESPGSSSNHKAASKGPIDAWNGNQRRGPGGGGAPLTAVSTAVRNGVGISSGRVVDGHGDLENGFPLRATSLHSRPSPTIDQKHSTGFSSPPQPAWEVTPAAIVKPQHHDYHNSYVSSSPPAFDDTSITVSQ